MHSPSRQDLDISVQLVAGQTTVAMAGRFTFGAHAAFRTVLDEVVERIDAGGRLVFDLSAVAFVDSSALGMLLLAREGARRRSGGIVLRGAVGQVQRMLAVSRFDTLFSIEP